MGIGLMRVEIELAALSALAALAAVVCVLLALGMLCRPFINGTVGATPPLRPIVVSPVRQENTDAPPP
jgi:hypothetical protein